MGKDKLWTRDYLFVIIMSTFQNLQNQLVNPIMARFSQSVGIDIGLTGIIVGVFSLAALVVRPASGRLSDRLNNKLLATVSSLVMGVATMGYVMSGGNVSLLLIFRFLHGMAFGVCGTTMLRMASNLTPVSRMGEGMGFFGLGQVISIALAPGIGLFLADRFGYDFTFGLSTLVICGVGVMCLFITLPQGKNPPNRGKGRGISCFVAPETLGFALVAFTLFFANSTENNFIILYGESLSLQNLGLIFTVSAVTMLLSRTVTGKLLDNRGFRFVMIPALLCIVVSMILLASASLASLELIFPVFLCAAVIKAIGHATAQPAIQTACLQAVSADRRGLAASTFYMGCDVGMGLGPIVGGAIVGHAGFPSLYLGAAFVAFLGLLLFLFFTRKKQT